MTTLDAMGWGPLYDEKDGGFFRYARRADWGEPNGEKLLDVNASLLDLYVEPLETLRARRATPSGPRTSCATCRHGWPIRWTADGRDPSAPIPPTTPRSGGHASGRAPPVDRTLYTDWNAMMASAALKAGRVLNEPSLSEFAIRSLERIALLCYRPGAGVAHYHDGEAQVRGLLDDQIAMAAAQLDAFEATGDIVY